MTISSDDLTKEPVALPVPKPWGFWATALWGLLAATLWFGAQIVLLAIFVAHRASELAGHEVQLSDVADLATDGAAFAVITIVATPVSLAVFVLAARLRHWKALDYLALRWPNRQQLVVGVFFFVVLMLSCDGATYVSGRPIAHEFATDLYRSARGSGALVWLALAVIVASPIGEELFFRGFLFRGWAQSRLGVFATIVLTSLIWTSMHVQYDWFFQAQVFALGLLFGWLRWRSDSTALTILLHMLANLEASLLTAATVEWFG